MPTGLLYIYQRNCVFMFVRACATYIHVHWRWCLCVAENQQRWHFKAVAFYQISLCTLTVGEPCGKQAGVIAIYVANSSAILSTCKYTARQQWKIKYIRQRKEQKMSDVFKMSLTRTTWRTETVADCHKSCTRTCVFFCEQIGWDFAIGTCCIVAG